MSLYSTEMGDHLEIIIFSSTLLILLNSLISLTELHKTPDCFIRWRHSSSDRYENIYPLYAQVSYRVIPAEGSTKMSSKVAFFSISHTILYVYCSHEDFTLLREWTLQQTTAMQAMLTRTPYTIAAEKLCSRFCNLIVL